VVSWAEVKKDFGKFVLTPNNSSGYAELSADMSPGSDPGFVGGFGARRQGGVHADERCRGGKRKKPLPYLGRYSTIPRRGGKA